MWTAWVQSLLPTYELCEPRSGLQRLSVPICKVTNARHLPLGLCPELNEPKWGQHRLGGGKTPGYKGPGSVSGFTGDGHSGETLPTQEESSHSNRYDNGRGWVPIKLYKSGQQANRVATCLPLAHTLALGRCLTNINCYN